MAAILVRMLEPHVLALAFLRTLGVTVFQTAFRVAGKDSLVTI
jgi:hypothetical protein